MNSENGTSPSFGARLVRAFINLIRILLIFALIAGIAAAVYFGVPYLYRLFILPVETNTSRLVEIENKQEADIEQLANQVSDLKERLAGLENRQTENAQEMAELEGKVTVLETAVETHSESLQQLETMQDSLDSLFTTLLENEVLFEDVNASFVDLQRQITITRATELLSRGLLYLSQSNFGLARQDVQNASDLLIGLEDEIPQEKEAAYKSVLFRLDLALSRLPDFPVMAVADVEIAWQILANDLVILASESID